MPRAADYSEQRQEPSQLDPFHSFLVSEGGNEVTEMLPFIVICFLFLLN
jgi:hypothetical protein